MSLSVFDFFSIGIGPSSSHTVGPMKAAHAFAKKLQNRSTFTSLRRITIELFGSLAFTGKGHGTDKAILLGLEGHLPDKINPDYISPCFDEILKTRQLKIGEQTFAFEYAQDMIFQHHTQLPLHTNGMRFSVYDERKLIWTDEYYSIGGGFVLDSQANPLEKLKKVANPPYPFESAKSLLAHCENNQLSIAEVMLANEIARQPRSQVETKLLNIAKAMQDCIKKGCDSPGGTLPGGLNIKRRAPELHAKLMQKGKPLSNEHTDSMAWLNLFAIAVNEENAAGSRVVTAPTNGAAGIIPAVLNYYLHFYPSAKPKDAIPFLLTAGAVAILYKTKASISGAEVGCQGEVGVACSMAAAALTSILGGTLYQIENAAEIAMEHHLGLTCDPIHGLVQIPCIERNAMGAVKAVNATHLALLGNGAHYVSLDKVIATMKQTGKDMKTIYKETSLGGLAANLPEC